VNLSILKTAAVLSVALASGCASIINDREQTVRVLTSNGQKVEAIMNGLPIEAPTSVSLPREGNSIDITPSTEGCEPTTLDVGISWLFWANIITGGATGSTTDAVSQKMWDYDDSVTINCK